jgi:hypothetical protein
MSRTALQIAQDAAVKLGLTPPSVLFSSTDRTDIELRRCLIEAADKIVRAHDWELLKRLEAHDGDGTTTEYAKPSDYLRMPKEAQVWSTRWERPLLQISPQDWLHLDIREYDTNVGTWTFFGGNFVYRPALAADEDAKFFYVSNAVIAPQSGDNKATFTADDDSFRLDDRVLELVLIWVWRAQKSLDYAEEQATAEMALARAIADDKGARIIIQQSRRNMRAKIAYPWSIAP